MGWLRCLWGGMVLGLALLGVGCGGPSDRYADDLDRTDGDSTTISGSGDDGSGGDGGSGGDLFPTGGAGGAPGCEGVCVVSELIPFDRVTMVSIGTPETVRACPEWAPIVGFEGFGGLAVAPHACAGCACSPTGCALPTAMHVTAGKCPGEGAPSVEWEVTPGWEGVCSEEGGTPAGISCGGVACVQSVTVEAPVVEPCVPAALGGSSMPEPVWGTMARECLVGPLSGEGCGLGEACAPAPPEGFSLCLFLEGDESAFECPGVYPRRVEVFAGAADMRECAPCACSAPDGASCAVLVAAFGDEACGAPLGSVVVTAEESACFDVPSGSALGSKSAAWLVDSAGSCAPSGGTATGALVPAGPVTLCCQPEPEPAD